MVLLKNEGSVLPLDASMNTAVIGPLAKNQHDMLGPWWGRGDDNDVVTVFDGIDEQNTGTTTYAEGCQLSNGEVPFDQDPDPKDRDPEGCTTIDTAAVNTAVAGADQVVLALGETREMSGEANVRSKLDLPGRQEELIQAVKATGKPFAVVLFSGRPLALEDIVGRHARDPRGLVPGRAGGPGGRRRGVRQGQPRRQAPRVVPVPGRPGADLLQPRGRRTAVQQEHQVELAAP